MSTYAMMKAAKRKSKAKLPVDPTPEHAKKLRSLEAIGERLRSTRQALELSQRDFCAEAGVPPNTYNQYERGVARPSMDNAYRLMDAHRLTLDWIYAGDPSGLRASLLEAIKAQRNVQDE